MAAVSLFTPPTWPPWRHVNTLYNLFHLSILHVFPIQIMWQYLGGLNLCHVHYWKRLRAIMKMSNFERKYSSGYRHMISLGKTNRLAKTFYWFLWVLGGSFAPHLCENVYIPASRYGLLVQYFSSYLYELQNHWNMTKYVSFRFPMFSWKMSVFLHTLPTKFSLHGFTWHDFQWCSV